MGSFPPVRQTPHLTHVRAPISGARGADLYSTTIPHYRSFGTLVLSRGCRCPLMLGAHEAQCWRAPSNFVSRARTPAATLWLLPMVQTLALKLGQVGEVQSALSIQTKTLV